MMLVGLGLTSLFGWSWAGPVGALVIAGVALRERLDLARRPLLQPGRCLYPTRQGRKTTAGESPEHMVNGQS